MSKSLLNVLGAALLVALGLTVWGMFGLNRTLQIALSKWGDGGQREFDEIHQTLQTLNAPCVGFHGSVSCGPLAQLSQTEKNIGIVAGQSALQVKQTGILITSAATSVQAASNDIHAIAGSASKTLDAATETAQGATTAIETLNTSIAATKPLIEAGTKTINDFDFYATDPAVKKFVANLEPLSNNATAITGNLAATTGDFQTKFHAFLYPPPCHGFKCDLLKAWPIIKGISSLAEPGYWGYELIQQVH